VTEAGFVRICANPRVGGREIEVALAMLQTIKALPNCSEFPIDTSWMNLVAPFAGNLHGYRQVTDAFLLGIAIRHEAILVTLDRHIHALAGRRFQSSILTLQDPDDAP
jgi:predicted nucleic acid-binding protein